MTFVVVTCPLTNGAFCVCQRRCSIAEVRRVRDPLEELEIARSTPTEFGSAWEEMWQYDKQPIEFIP